MESRKLLSICIPTYNRGQYLFQMTQDLIEQIRKLHVESIMDIKISDNGSTDNTWHDMNSFLDKNKDIDIQVYHFDTNKGADLNFVKVLEMSDGTYTLLKGDDDYIGVDGLNYIINLLLNNPDIDYFISDYDVINPQRKVLFSVEQLRTKKEQLIVNCDEEAEMRNYFSLSESIMSLGSFISAFIIKTEAFKCDLDKSFYGTFYAHVYFIWNYLMSGSKRILYNKHKYIEQCFDGKTNPDFGYGFKRRAVDLNMCVILCCTVFKNTPYKTDILRIAQRMYPCPIYYNRNQRKDYIKYLLPSMEKAEYPNIKYAKRNSGLWHLIFFLLSQIPYSIDHYLRKRFYN